MAIDLRDSMMLYGVTLGKRRTRREKLLFGQHLAGEAMPGWTVQPQEGGKGSFHTVNLIAGDPERAKTVFVVPYDTPARALYPMKYYPFHPELNIRQERFHLLAQILVMAALLALAYIPLSLAFVRRGMWWLMLIPAAALVLLSYLVFRGTSNPFNFNRASASVAVGVRLAGRLRKHNDVAIAFCDRSVLGYQGYKLLAGTLPRSATVILLDCIAQGEELVVASTPFSAVPAKHLVKRLPEGTRHREYKEGELERNLLSVFQNGIVVTGGSIEKGELVVRNTRTPKDVELDLPRLQAIEDALVALANE